MVFGESEARLVVDLAEDRPATVVAFGGEVAVRRQPLVEILTVGAGHALSNTRFTHSAIGSRLRYVDHAIETAGLVKTLRIRQVDDVDGLEVVSVLRTRSNVPAVQAWTEITNVDGLPVTLQAVTSFATGAFVDDHIAVEDFVLGRARAEWCAESRWSWIPLAGRDGLPSINTALHDHDARGSLVTVSRSTWSSGEFLPTGVLTDQRTGRSWAWQIEHNGPWRFELDSGRDDSSALVLLLGGPNDLDHQWTKRLTAGETFESVPVAIATSERGWEGAIAALTEHRRAIKRAAPADAELPLVFNDYMNTLMGDPTTERLMPLIAAAAATGAEIFCIDAGWYDDGGAWWPSVGEWIPSIKRFPGGFDEVLDRIRDAGMQVGLWVEPEVIGIHSPMASRLPDEAFLQRYGERIVEHERYHLDLRHPAVIAHLDEVFDRLIGQAGARFFKLDYNVTPGAGTDLDAFSVGDGLLQHNRAHLAWLDALIARHPDVVFENCASGAMRMDYAMLSRLDLQSTSDQQDPLLYAAIAASAPASVLPEQAGNWAYPQPGTSSEAIAYCMVNGLAGRLYLSGPLDRMSEQELALVNEAVDVYKSSRRALRRSTPVWPLGLPAWRDDTVALGLETDAAVTLAVWHRTDAPAHLELPIPSLFGMSAVVDTVYPTTLPPWPSKWDEKRGLVVIDVPAGAAARLLRIHLP